MGIEPMTLGLKVPCSNLLSYGPIWCPRKDSNLDPPVMSRLHLPLCYKGLVGVEGLEPSRPRSRDFKSPASAIPPHPQILERYPTIPLQWLCPINVPSALQSLPHDEHSLSQTSPRIRHLAAVLNNASPLGGQPEPISQFTYDFDYAARAASTVVIVPSRIFSTTSGRGRVGTVPVD